MKKCPFCAEEIQDEALKCKHCGEFLKKKHKVINCLLGCLFVLLIIILLVVIFIYLVFLAYNALISKMIAWQANLPHFSLPFTFNDTQVMFNDLGEGFQAFREFLSDDSLKNYQSIKL